MPSQYSFRTQAWIHAPMLMVLGMLCGCEFPAPSGSALAILPLRNGAAAEAPVIGLKKSFGIYQWAKNASYEDGLASEIAALGTPPSYALYFVDLDHGFPSDVVRANASRNIQTIVTQELSLYGRAWNENVLKEISQGKWDAQFRAFARAAKAYQGMVYYRFGYEMNGDWVAWGEKPVAFRRAWAHAHDVFAHEGARNVKWVWSPNVLWGDRNFNHDLKPYYPGNAYVDFVGLDGYNFGEHHHAWQSFAQVFGASITGLKTSFPEKPLWITEVGCADGAQKAEWIQDFLQTFNADPDLHMFVWFNEDKQYAGEPNWRLDSDMDSMHRFRDWAVFNNSITTFSLPGPLPPPPALVRQTAVKAEALL